MPKISVIIPVYNGAKTIRQTINSVLNQTLQDFEILVINDGSTDSTLEILANLIDSRIQVFSYANSGAPVSRNRGFSIATGEYIAFLDADDLWTPDKLQSQYQALKSNPEAAVAYSWTDHINESGEFLQSGRHLTINGDVYPQLLIQNFLENGSNPLIHRQAFADIGGFDESLLGGQDRDLYLRLAARYPFVGIPSVQILYRMSPHSISSNLLRQEKQCIKVIDKAFLEAPESLQHLKKQSLARIYKYLTYRAMQGYPSQQNGQAAIRFIFNYILYEASAWKQWRFLLILLLKSTIISVFPPQLSTDLITYFQSVKRN